MAGRRSLPFALLALIAALVVPAGAPAATLHSFENPAVLFPAGDLNATFGPANHYPSTIEVEGLAGTVTEVTAEVLRVSSGRSQDIDMALEDPDGDVTMLMSDACGEGGIASDDIRFDDAAPTFLSQLACASNQRLTAKPTNYFNFGEGDELGLEEGPEGPYLNTMAALAGGEPDGEWNLYALDDHEGVVGFEIAGWRLSLAVEPPPPAPPATPTPPVTTSPATPPAAIVTPPAPIPPAPAATKTGKRAKALARCKKKKAGKARRACRKAARKLPL
jgi:hypothetical protein